MYPVSAGTERGRRHSQSPIRPHGARTLERDIKDLLIAWGRGRALSSAENGYPHQSAFARFIRNPGSANVVALPIPEDVFMAVDKAASELRTRRPGAHTIIVLAYIHRMSDAAIGRKQKCSRSTVRNAREAAENWIAGRILA